MKLDGYSFKLCQECVDKWDSRITKASEAFTTGKSELLISSVQNQKCG